MKSRIIFMGLLMVTAVVGASAQAEFDDMYFRASDREKIAASKPLSELSSRQSEIKTPINPTDSYSARNVNPEYISQSVNGAAPQQQVSYFYADYVPTAVNQNLYNNRANWNYYGMNNPYMMGGMNPYMVGGYNPYGNAWGMDPYGFNNGFNNGFYRPGFNMSLGMGMGWGNSWGYSPWNNMGWNNMGWNSMAWDPYGYNSFNNWGWGNNMGMGWNNWGWNSWNRPTVIIVGGGDGANRVVYGKRSSRSSDMNNNVNTGGGSRQSAAIQNDTRGGSNSRSTARTASVNENYYQRGWRNNPENTSTRPVWNNSTSGSNTRSTGSTFNNSSRSSNRSTWLDNSSSGSSSRSSSGFSSGNSGGSRSSGSSSGGGSSSSGGSRGRN